MTETIERQIVERALRVQSDMAAIEIVTKMFAFFPDEITPDDIETLNGATEHIERQLRELSVLVKQIDRPDLAVRLTLLASQRPVMQGGDA